MSTDDAPAPVPDEVLEDLRRRVRATRRVPVVPGGWSRGTDPDLLTGLLEHWGDGYDWRSAERRIRALPWTRTRSGLRVVHQRAADPAARALVLLHGWPDSVLRFERVLPLLSDVHVVVPALPGYPWSDSAGTAGADMAQPVAAAMSELGYDRYTVSGGDIGTSVAQALALTARDHVASVHLTDVPFRQLTTLPEHEWTDEERTYREAVGAWQAAEGAYAAEQATKPATLAVALGDSPAGLLAWLLEKYRSWSDCAGDVLTVWSRDVLLTWVTAYWVTGAIGTSFTPYSERRPPDATRIPAPAVISSFPKDLLHAPRSYAERFLDVRLWDEQPSGGHFAAWERPEAFAAAVRAAIALA